MKAKGNVCLVSYSDFNPLQSTSFHYNFPLIPLTQGKSEILKYWNIEIDFNKPQRWIQDSLTHSILSYQCFYPSLVA